MKAKLIVDSGLARIAGGKIQIEQLPGSIHRSVIIQVGRRR
jgi:hypothetical protein